MLISPSEAPMDLRAGIYRHYKGPLYQVLGYSHNASDYDKIQILYVGLQLDPEKAGPRLATRNWREFFNTVCPIHQGVDAYSHEHAHMRRDDGLECVYDDWVERFTYQGPIYYKGFEELNDTRRGKENQ